MREPEDIAFRNHVANHIRLLRSLGHSRKEINMRVVSFCDGWSALGHEMDKVYEKYECKSSITV
jgi:hypothetical protein